MSVDTINLIMDGCAVLFLLASLYYLFRWLRIMVLVMKKSSVMGEIMHVKLGEKDKRQQFVVEYSYRVSEHQKYTRTFQTLVPEYAQLGKKLKVYYDPRNPQKSYSSAEEKTERKTVLFCLFVLVFSGVMSLFY